MKIGNKKHGIVQLFKQRILVELDLKNIPTYHYRDIIPKQCRKNESLHDIVVASSLLQYHGYMTEWELIQVITWVQQHNKMRIFDALKTCRAIQKGAKNG